MDAKAINKFPIREYLASRGIRPAKDRSYCGLYHSPLREDHMPSMKVDYDKNLWIDYGAGEGKVGAEINNATYNKNIFFISIL